MEEEEDGGGGRGGGDGGEAALARGGFRSLGTPQRKMKCQDDDVDLRR